MPGLIIGSVSIFILKHVKMENLASHKLWVRDIKLCQKLNGYLVVLCAQKNLDYHTTNTTRKVVGFRVHPKCDILAVAELVVASVSDSQMAQCMELRRSITRKFLTPKAGVIAILEELNEMGCDNKK